jgi:hypothetical protein
MEGSDDIPGNKTFEEFDVEIGFNLFGRIFPLDKSQVNSIWGYFGVKF